MFCLTYGFLYSLNCVKHVLIDSLNHIQWRLTTNTIQIVLKRLSSVTYKPQIKTRLFSPLISDEKDSIEMEELVCA